MIARTTPPRLTIASCLSLVLALSSLARSPAEAQSSSPLVEEVSLFRDGIGRVAWSAQGDWLAFDRRDPEHGNYQLWVMKRDGTFERCLTCEPLDLRRENCINPTWHPSGDWIVFQLQSQARRLGLGPVELAGGDRGLWSEIEVIRRDGKGFWQLTRANENGSTVLDPQFSFEGDELLWSERVRSRVGRWGIWALRTAQFRPGAVPRLAKPRLFEPGEQRLYLSGSSFTPDDRGALIAGNLMPGQGENGMDIYRLTFEGEKTERLTHTDRGWDERATYTVKGDRILWVSSSAISLRDVGRAARGADGTRPEGEVDTAPGRREPALPLELLRDLWVMNPDGSDQQRLTFFNDPEARESLGAAIVDDFAQSPDGGEILAHVIWERQGEVREGLYLVRLDESFRR
jgi:Tol biopolymer transport system component